MIEREKEICKLIYCKDDNGDSGKELFNELNRLNVKIRSLWLGLRSISHYIQFDKEKDDLGKFNDVIAVLEKYNCKYEIDENKYFKTVYFIWPSAKTPKDVLFRAAQIAGKYDWYFKVISYPRFGLVKFEIAERDFNKFVTEFKVLEQELENKGYFVDVHTDYASDIDSKWHHKFGVLQVFIVIAG